MRRKRGRAVREKKASDHFDGKVFFNPTIPGLKPPGFREVLKMLLTDKRAKWPTGVANLASPRLNEDLSEGRVALTFVNHASFLIQLEGLNILTDPVWSKRASPFQWAGPARARLPGIGLESLPRIDVILLSHNHYDHLDTGTLKTLAIKFSPVVICAKGDETLIRSLGFENVHELDWWESVLVPISSLNTKTKMESKSHAKITFTPTQHFSARGLFDRCRSLWGAYTLEVHRRRIYFGGDAAYSTHFKETEKRFGNFDLALLGIGAYKPNWFMKSMHMDPEGAVMAHLDLKAKQSVGMHFGTFQLSSEAIDQPVIDLGLALLKHQVSPNDFVTMAEGETRCF